MYEEDSWSEPQKLDETGSGVAAATEGASDAAEERQRPVTDSVGKSGTKKTGKTSAPKKKIPKWQVFALGGMLFVGVAGVATLMIVEKHPSSGMVLNRQSPPPQGQIAGAGPTRAPFASAAPSGASGGGFASLNALSKPPAPLPAAPSPAVTAMSAPVISSAAAPVSVPVSSASSVPVLENGTVPTVAPGVSAAAMTASSTQGDVVDRLRNRLLKEDAEIASLRAELAKAVQAEASGRNAADANVAPKVITRTVIRYVRAPAATPAPRRVVPSSTRASGEALHGWSLVGGNDREAMLSGPDGQVRSVRPGDTVDGAIVRSVGIGEVRTSEGVIR